MAVQNGTPVRKRRRTNKPQELVEKAAALRLEAKSDRQIAKELDVKPNNIPNMLSESELIEDFRRQLRSKVDKALANIDVLLDLNKLKDMGFHELPVLPHWRSATQWVLENTQVGVKREERDVTSRQDRVMSLSAEERKLLIAEYLKRAKE
jgi:hypothetical protein